MYNNSEPNMCPPIFICGVRVSGPQVVYVMERNGYYKIGFSSNLTQSAPARSHRRSIVAIIEVPDHMNVYLAEKAVHLMFSAKNLAGYETFDLDERDLGILGRLRFRSGRLVLGRKK